MLEMEDTNIYNSPSLARWGVLPPSSSPASVPPMEQQSQELESQQWVSSDQILLLKVSSFNIDHIDHMLMHTTRHRPRHHGWYHRYLRLGRLSPDLRRA